MRKTLTTQSKYFSHTLEEAQSLLSELSKELGDSIKKQTISRRTKKVEDEYFDYFIVEVTVEKFTISNFI